MPIQNGQYVAPTWVNGNRPAINATELQAMCDTLENGQTVTFQNFTNIASSPQQINDVKPLLTQSYNLAGASVGNYAIFAGGTDGANSLSNVVAYDDLFTQTIAQSLSVAGANLTGASVGNYAIFAGGNNRGTSLDAYDESLTHTYYSNFVNGYDLSSASIKNLYALFSGYSIKNNAITAYDY